MKLFALIALLLFNSQAFADNTELCNNAVRNAALAQASVDFPAARAFIYRDGGIGQDPLNAADVLTITVAGGNASDDIDVLGDYDVHVRVSATACVALSAKLRR